MVGWSSPAAEFPAAGTDLTASPLPGRGCAGCASALAVGCAPADGAVYILAKEAGIICAKPEAPPVQVDRVSP